jgi:phospholipid/cholesterol/gamma-HCH transport system ATP-binding protein
MNKIVLNKVSVILNNNKILSDISFNIEENYSVCLIGRGSSGKSTLLKSILGLVDLSDGDIKIDKTSIFEKSFKDKINSFGVVFQKDALFDSLRVWENIMFKSLGKLTEDKLIEKSFFYLSKVGLDKREAFLYPAELSGGMKKRVAIARAVSHNPKFLLLDDPTAGLDPVKTNMIFRIIRQLSEELKTTVLTVTSDMRGALNFFKYIVVLEDSKIHWQGNSSEARRKPTEHMKNLFYGV